MTFKEFIDFIKEGSSAYELFHAKALDFQNIKNKARTGKAKWNEKKIERAITAMWEQSMQVLYDKIKTEVGMPLLNAHEKWLEYISNNNVLELLTESISESDFD